MSDTVLYDLSDGVATVTLHRPDAMNALNTELKVALRDTLAAAAEDEAVRAVLLTGTGRAFCVGQDLARARAEPRRATWTPSGPPSRSTTRRSPRHSRRCPSRWWPR